MIRSKIVGDVSKNTHYELVLGDGYYYKHKETGIEIRLYHYSGNKIGDPASIRVSGFDKHGKQYNLAVQNLFEAYVQKQQLDFTDPVDPRLPYVFDLLYDVKTVSELKRYIDENGMEQEMREIMLDNNLSFDSLR